MAVGPGERAANPNRRTDDVGRAAVNLPANIVLANGATSLWQSKACARPHAAAVDRFLGEKIRSRRVKLRVSLQQVADAMGVTYQQAHKYEKGVNRIAAGRLPVIAEALEVDVGYFFEGLKQLEAPKLSPQQRMLLELTQSFQALPNLSPTGRTMRAARAIVKGEMAGERGSPVNAALA